MTNPDASTRLQGLILFEAAARHQNFTLVAQECGTSQPAVSQRIAALEKDLGVVLFHRSRRGVTLTPDGASLLGSVRDPLAAIALAVDKLRQRGARHVLTVATDFAFAHFWLMPRLAQFQQLHPETDVRVVTSQAAFDIRREAIDLAIWFGDGNWTGCTALPMLPEVVVPVCSPALLAQDGRAPQALVQATPLLHLDSQGQMPWMTWEGWAALQGVDLPEAAPAGNFPNYPLLIQAAVAGRGVALGWRPLVDQLLLDGALAAWPVPELRTQCGYHLVTANDRPAGQASDDLVEWILGAVQAAR